MYLTFFFFFWPVLANLFLLLGCVVQHQYKGFYLVILHLVLPYLAVSYWRLLFLNTTRKGSAAWVSCIFIKCFKCLFKYLLWTTVPSVVSFSIPWFCKLFVFSLATNLWWSDWMSGIVLFSCICWDFFV